MSNHPIPVVKFLFKDDFKSLNEALRLAPGFEVEDFSTANDLATFLSTIPAGLVIASLRNKDDLVQIASYMKLGKKLAKECVVKVVVINFSNDRTYEKAIAKLGILDLVEPSINTKALKFKLDFWMKSLTAQAKLSGKTESQKVVKSSEQNKQVAADKKADPSIPVWVPPLELEDDIWIVKNESEVKKILSKWLIRVVGPSPYVGQWVELKAGLWRYDIKESEKEMFVPNEGAWYFAGEQKPDFIWKENNWLITGENFDLFFKDAKQITSRLKSKDKILTISKNSLYAKTKEQIIIESFDKELVFKKEAEKLENLEGKNKTDQIENANLEGKTKTAADKSGNLKGKVENQEAINNENLEQAANNEKVKTYWDGKNEYKDETAENLDLKGEKARKDKELDQKNDLEHEKYYKNHNETKKFGIADLDKKERPEAEYEDHQAEDMKGKSSTDEIQGYYDNKKKTKERSEDGQRPEEMSGKSETDRIKSHYGQKDSERSEKEQRPDEMSGKSETDRIKSHYGQKDSERSEKEQRQNEMSGKPESDKNRTKSEKAHKERQFSDEDMAEEESEALSGKSETEKLKSHYSKKDSERSEKELNEKDFANKSEFEKAKAQKEQKERNRAEREEPEAKGMSGKSSTDKIAGHYGGPKDRDSLEKENQESDDQLEALKQLEKKYKEKPSQDGEDLYARADRQRTGSDSEDSEIDSSGHDKSAKKNRGQSGVSDKDMYARDKKLRPEQSQSEPEKDDFDDYIDDSEANKLTSQSVSKKGDSKTNSLNDDHYDLAEAREARKSTDRSSSNDGKIADILPLNKAKTEKAKEATKVALDEKGLDELTRDAKVLSTIIYKGKKISCELNDFFDDTIIFLTQEKSIEISSKVQLDLAFKFLEKDKKLNMEGSVATVDGDGEGNSFVTIQLTKENTAAFDVFMRLYETRQSNVNEFIKKVKGL